MQLLSLDTAIQHLHIRISNPRTDAAFREGDARAPLDAKQQQKIAETGNLFLLFCLCSTVCFIANVPLWFCVCSSIDAKTGNQKSFYLRIGLVGGSVLVNMLYELKKYYILRTAA